MPKKTKKTETVRASTFEYTPIIPEQQVKYIMLTVKLVSWSYLNFTVRIPSNTTIGAIKYMILNYNKQSIVYYKLTYGVEYSICYTDSVVSAVTKFDYHIINTAVSSDIRLYKGSPLTFPPLSDDDSLTLEDHYICGDAEKITYADLFYDFVACRIMGNGKEKF